MSETVSHQVSTMRQCSACGSKNADDAVFCSACGATFNDARPAESMPLAIGTTKPVPIVRTITPLAQWAPQFSTPTPMPTPSPRTQMAIGSCFYHPELPASYVCVRCGRTICFSCTKPCGQLALCPQCYWTLAPRTSTRPQGR